MIDMILGPVLFLFWAGVIFGGLFLVTLIAGSIIMAILWLLEKLVVPEDKR